MLPGVRFLFAAILISTSLLVFALGAAALLRATHEQFVSNPSWRSGPQEQVFAQAPEPVRPVLAALRVEPMAPETEPSVRDQIPTIAMPVTDAAPEQSAALAVEATVPPAEVQPIEPPPPEAPATAGQADAPPATPAVGETTGQVSENRSSDTRVDAAETASLSPPAAASAPPQTEAIVSTLSEADLTRVAALNDLTAAPGKEPAPKIKADGGASEKKATKRRAHRAKKRRIVRRPPPPVQQQSFDPFTQQPIATASTTRTR